MSLSAWPTWDEGRREEIVVASLAVALVLMRSIVATVYEGFYFDSDQAIIGLMARHLSNFERFPLFYYRLNYILGVESWIIAPFFWLVGSSVAVMRAPLVALNALVAVWLVMMLGRRIGVRPFVAFLAALPFIMPAPVAANHLLETAGACVEPFVYVLMLWHLKDRPIAFGALLGLGFLHREFTIFAVPAIIIVEASRGELWNSANLRRATRMAAGFGAVWLLVNAIRLQQSGVSLGWQALSLARQMCTAPGEWRDRAVSVVTQALPVLYGGTFTRLQDFRMNTPVTAGSSLVGWMVGITIVAMMVRLLMVWANARRLDRQSHHDGITIYLALVGAFAVCAYPLSCNVIPGQPPLIRYLLLGLLLPVGCFAAFMQREPSRALKTAAAGVFVLWGAANLADNARLIATSVRHPPSSAHRELADYLVSHHIGYARAIYWDAYVVDFLSRERVIVAAVDLVRIPEYKRIVDENAGTAVNLVRIPCSKGERVSLWCVQQP